MIVLCLKAARVNCNLTLVQAAEKLGINKDTLSRFERNSTDIPRSLCIKMQKLYQLPEKHLFFGDVNDFFKDKNM